MRAAALFPLLVTMTARAACLDPMEIPVAPLSPQPACSYRSADVAAAGATVVGAWMTSISGSLGVPYTIGSMSGGTLDAHGRLPTAVQARLNDGVGYPALATNGTQSLLTWSLTRAGTYVQFLGSPAVTKISTGGTTELPPRPYWDGRDWIVVVTEGAQVVSLRIASDGSVLERTTVAENAKVLDATAAAIVVERSTGFELITPAARHTLPFIPAGSTVAIDGDLLAWHGGAIGAVRLSDVTTPIAIATADPGTKRIAVAGDVILWNDGTTVRGVRLGATARPLAPREGQLYGAAKTSEGVVALLSGTCGSVASYFVAPGADELALSDYPARVYATQSDVALVPTARGHHVYWMEERPLDHGWHLFVARVDGHTVSPAVKVNAPGTGASAVDAAPSGGGSVVAWSEHPQSFSGVVKVARVEADGVMSEPVTITSFYVLRQLAVTSRGDHHWVFTAEQATETSETDLWSTEVRPDGTIVRTLLRANAGQLLDAAMTPEGPIVTWLDTNNLSREAWTLHVGDRLFPIATDLTRLAVYDGGLVVRVHDRRTVRALFPATGVEATITDSRDVRLVDATPRADGSFDVVVDESDNLGTRLRTYHVSRTGVVTRREEICLDEVVFALSMRAGSVDAVLTWRDHALHVEKLGAPPRRRAVRR